MEDRYGRKIEYLRISITDRCNFRCRYCMPGKGVELKTQDDILSFEEIIEFVKLIVPLGINKIKITGGEPLVRKGVVDFIEKLSSINGIKDISLTTNGYLLSDMAKELKEAGLARANVSLDSLKPLRFKKITRFGELSKVLLGIRTALEVGLRPVKINCVVIKGFNNDEIMDFIKLTQEFPLSVRFIELMPLGDREWCNKHFISVKDIKASINQKLIPITSIPAGAGPAVYYKIPNSIGNIGFIAPISQHFCHMCNRLRLTADGKLKPCLVSSSEIDIKSAFYKNKCDEILKILFKLAIDEKPFRHHMTSELNADHFRKMWQIGG